MWHYRKAPSIKDNLFFIYIFLAGVERFIIEFLRTNQKYVLEIFSGAQIISLVMIVVGLYFLKHPITNAAINPD